MHELCIHSAFGPTSYAGDLEDLPALMADLRRLNTPASNAGRYALILTVQGEESEIVPTGSDHTHGYRVFCAPCHRAHQSQWQNPQPGDTVWP